MHYTPFNLPTPDEITLEYVKGRTLRPYSLYASDPGAPYRFEKTYEVGDLEPQVACPSSPGNVAPISRLGEVSIDQAVIGSCTNGRLEDLRLAAKVLKGRRAAKGVRLIIIPATPLVWRQAMDEGPRQVMGDLSELIASISEKGVIEPLIVRQRGERFQIVAGERRYQAAVQVGLMELPVFIREVDDREMLEIALVENLQRKDLTPFEEAEALQSLVQRYGHTHEDLARRLGKSRTAITESLSLTKMPD